MSANWQVTLLLAGCFMTASIVCHAEQHAKNELKTNNQMGTMVQRSARAVVPSKTMDHIFDNLYHHPDKKIEKDQFISWKEYKAKLRESLALNFSDSIQIGLDRFKSGPLKPQKEEIVDINSHLAPKAAEGHTARGYGVQMRMKLD